MYNYNYEMNKINYYITLIELSEPADTKTGSLCRKVAWTTGPFVWALKTLSKRRFDKSHRTICPCGVPEHNNAFLSENKQLVVYSKKAPCN
jgi:hypothetical protein